MKPEEMLVQRFTRRPHCPLGAVHATARKARACGGFTGTGTGTCTRTSTRTGTCTCRGTGTCPALAEEGALLNVVDRRWQSD